jgi:hypothetical protein
MLVIRQDQMHVFKRAALKKFEDELVEHLKTFAPKLFEIRGKECIRKTVQMGMQRAREYGFTYRGPIRFYLEAMFSLGSDFDTDPQMPWALELLTTTEEASDQMSRADQLYRQLIIYMNKVMGPDNRFAITALRRLSTADQDVFMLPSDHFSAFFTLFRSYYPEKYTHVGEEQLTILINKGKETAKKFGLDSIQGKSLIIILMFAIGHGITRDPLYPWVKDTLTSPQFEGEGERVNRLFKRTRTYLESTLQHLV